MQATLESPPSCLTVADVLDVVPTAVSIVARRLPAWVDRDDLASAGYLALMQAFPRAPRGEGEARAFLLRRVAGALRDELRRSDGVGRRTRHLLARVQATSRSLAQALGRDPAIAEIAAAMGEPVARIEAAFARAEDATRAPDPEAVLATVATDGPSPMIAVEASSTLQATLGLLDLLTPGERTVVARTILDGLTLDEVAVELGVTKGRASQLRVAGLKRLREHPSAARLWAELGNA